LPGNAISQQIDASIERLLAGFRWQRIDFVDALIRPVRAALFANQYFRLRAASAFFLRFTLGFS